jgi:hypothetical protein
MQAGMTVQEITPGSLAIGATDERGMIDRPGCSKWKPTHVYLREEETTSPSDTALKMNSKEDRQSLQLAYKPVISAPVISAQSSDAR